MKKNFILLGLFLFIFNACSVIDDIKLEESNDDDTTNENTSTHDSTWKSKFPSLWSLAYAGDDSTKPEDVTYEEFVNAVAAVLKNDQSFTNLFAAPLVVKDFYGNTIGQLEDFGWDVKIFFPNENKLAQYIYDPTDIFKLKLISINQSTSMLWDSTVDGYIYGPDDSDCNGDRYFPHPSFFYNKAFKFDNNDQIYTIDKDNMSFFTYSERYYLTSIFYMDMNGDKAISLDEFKGSDDDFYQRDLDESGFLEGDETVGKACVKVTLPKVIGNYYYKAIPLNDTSIPTEFDGPYTISK